ncbi:MAG: cyclase family protein [Gaiellaceae bacterium]
MSSLADALRSATFHDVSAVIDDRLPVFPGHPVVAVDAEARTHERDGYFVQQLSFGEHTGSHVDAPAHAVASMDDHTIDRYPADRFIVPYVKYDVSRHAPGPGDLVTRAVLEEIEARDGLELHAGDIAIIQFGWDRHFKPEDDDADARLWWIRNAPGLAADACEYLAERGVSAVGSDTATCDTAVVDGAITSAVGHTRVFLPADILIFETLIGLAAAPPHGIFVGLPLRIRGGSGSPIRAVLIEDGARP